MDIDSQNGIHGYTAAVGDLGARGQGSMDNLSPAGSFLARGGGAGNLFQTFLSFHFDILSFLSIKKGRKKSPIS